MDRPTRSYQQSGRTRRRRKKKRKLRLFIFSVVLFSLVIGISAIGYASWRVNHALDQMVEEPGLAMDEPKETSASSSGDEAIVDDVEDEKKTMSILIMGRDYRPETGTNLTDVMIVAALDMEQGKLSMVSIPRDTKVRLPEIGERVKANEAYNIGEHIRLKAERNQEVAQMDGATLSKSMAGQLFDISVDHYILVDFKSFMAIVDEVGGIDVNVEREMIYNDPTDDTHIHLLPGEQHLNGKKALDWVRHRQDDRGPNFYSSDFDRNRRQKEAIKAIAAEMASIKGAANVLDVLDTMAEHIQTDLTKTQIKDLLWSFKTLDLNQIKSIDTPNVYWDSSRLQTVIPEEDLTIVHAELEEILSGKNG